MTKLHLCSWKIYFLGKFLRGANVETRRLMSLGWELARRKGGERPPNFFGLRSKVVTTYPVIIRLATVANLLYRQDFIMSSLTVCFPSFKLYTQSFSHSNGPWMKSILVHILMRSISFLKTSWKRVSNVQSRCKGKKFYRSWRNCGKNLQDAHHSKLDICFVIDCRCLKDERFGDRVAIVLMKLYVIFISLPKCKTKLHINLW